MKFIAFFLLLFAALNSSAESLVPPDLVFEGEVSQNKRSEFKIGNKLVFYADLNSFKIQKNNSKDEEIDYIYLATLPLRGDNGTQFQPVYGDDALQRIERPRQFCFLSDPEFYKRANDALQILLWPSVKYKDQDYLDRKEYQVEYKILAEMPKAYGELDILDADIENKNFKLWNYSNKDAWPEVANKERLRPDSKITRIKFKLKVYFKKPKDFLGNCYER